MPPTNSQDPSNPSTPPQSIPLRDLTRPPDTADTGDSRRGHNRGRSLLNSGSRPTSGSNGGPRYERLGDTSPSPTERARYGGVPSLQLPIQGHAYDYEPESPVGNPADFQAAMGFAGLLVPDISVSPAPQTYQTSYPPVDYDGSPYGGGFEDQGSYFAFEPESDRLPLTDPSALQPVSGAQPSTPANHGHSRSGSFQSVTFESPGNRGSRLGDDLVDLETGTSSRQHRSRKNSYGNSLTPENRNRSKSPSTTGALSRAGSIVRAMSQRVVNLSGEAELIEASARREEEASRDASVPTMDTFASLGSLSDESETRFQPKHKKDPLAAGPNYHQNLPTAPVEKAMRFFGGAAPEQSFEQEPEKPPNPLRGRSLGIFSAESVIRNKLCDLLVYPLTEPAILILIIVQTVLLAVDSSRSVYEHPRTVKWGSSVIDFALMVLFVIFTFEVIARIIVSGFVMNAPEYSTVNRKKDFKTLLLDKYHRVFKPQRTSTIRENRNPSLEAHTIVRSFTAIQSDAIRTVEQAQRLQLARRAFLRHSFNRLDFLAVVAFWAAFVMGLTGFEHNSHLYLFRMLSCLRILRLLALTNGTAVSNKDIPPINFADEILDYSAELKESHSSTGQRFFPYRFLLASLCNYWSSEL